jgi:hypothetical protein
MWWFMYVYVISPGFLHHFGVKFGDFDVYVKTPGFLICFQTISDRISVEVTAQMLSAGKFTSILHRCLCMIFVTIFMISMFIWYHRGFWYVFKEFPKDFRLKLWRWCVSQGNWPPFCIAAPAPFASCNVPMLPFMQFHRGFRDVFTTCSHNFRFKFELTCVSQGISPAFGLAALAPFPPGLRVYGVSQVKKRLQGNLEKRIPAPRSRGLHEHGFCANIQEDFWLHPGGVWQLSLELHTP